MTEKQTGRPEDKGTKSDVEEFCKSKFDEFVKTRTGYRAVHWEDVAQEDEPPDYYLYSGDVKYAVEVTTLMEKTEVGGKRLPRITIVASLSQLVDDVETSARQGNFLRGAYVVNFSRPIKNYRSVREHLFRGFLAYIQATRDVDSAPEQVIYKQCGEKCTITKIHDQQTYVGHIGPSGAKWEGEVAEEICNLLAERINSKHNKLGKLAEPKILLLYDAYLFARVDMYQQCLPKIPSLKSFHTVFVVQHNSDGFILASANGDWL